MNATEAKRKLCEIRSSLTDDKQKQAICGAMPLFVAVGNCDIYVVGNKLDKEK